MTVLLMRLTRILFVAIGAMLALATLSACSGGSSPESSPTAGAPTTSAAARPFPQSARFVADMKPPDGKPMTLGISVDGGEVVAYACNGTDDEAWFFGNQTDGTIGLKSKFRDTLNARFDGTDVDGDVTMNGVTYAFTAAPVSGEAGIYTADRDGVRATCVVRPSGCSSTGSAERSTRPTSSSSTTRSSAPRSATSGSSSTPSRSAACRTGRCDRRSTAATSRRRG